MKGGSDLPEGLSAMKPPFSMPVAYPAVYSATGSCCCWPVVAAADFDAAGESWMVSFCIMPDVTLLSF